MKKYKLDKEEQEILDAYEKGELKSVKLSKEEMERYIRAARNTLRKNERINIRISRSDLVGLRDKAVEEGIPYQTLISSILHKYVTGRLEPRHT
jgi:predicted DNA binding CopG/RHH family protein